MGTGTINIYFQNSYEPTSIVGFLTCHMARKFDQMATYYHDQSCDRKIHQKLAVKSI